MSHKSKGINAEREIIHMFWGTNEWTACRVAGSGAIKYPVPDIIAGNQTRKLAIECKATASEYQYLEKSAVQELEEYARKFNAEPWIAIKFDRKEWRFIQPKDLKITEKNYAATRTSLEQNGTKFETLISKKEE